METAFLRHLFFLSSSNFDILSEVGVHSWWRSVRGIMSARSQTLTFFTW